MQWHLNPFSSRHCFWHIWQYQRSFWRPFALIRLAIAFGVRNSFFPIGIWNKNKRDSGVHGQWNDCFQRSFKPGDLVARVFSKSRVRADVRASSSRSTWLFDLDGDRVAWLLFFFFFSNRVAEPPLSPLCVENDEIIPKLEF